MLPALLICFLLSGATSLVYEVLWVRMLILRLGSTSLAISTVLTAFMAGLAFGAWAAGRYSSRITRPLAAYALLELAIAGSAVLLPLGFEAIDPVYRAVWQQFQPQFLTFSLLQFAFTFLLLFVPTAMMGATLPFCPRLLSAIPMRWVSGSVPCMESIPWEPSWARWEAGSSCCLHWGVTKTIWATAAINAVLALAVWYLDRTFQRGEPEVPEGQERARERSPQGLEWQGNWLRMAVLAALFTSGFTSMVYQVAWSRTLSLVIGSSVYGFTIVLATFLSGLALGSLVMSRWIKHLKGSLAWWIFFVQLFIACAAYASSSLVNHLPYYYSRGYHWVEADPTWIYLLSSGLAALIILPSTFGMGAMFPLVVAFFTTARQEVGRLVGNLYSLNTVGAILGAFFGGFVFLSLLGIRTTLVTAIVINLYVALLVAVVAPCSLRTRVVTCLLPLGLIGAMVAMPPAWNSLLMSSGMYRYAEYLPKDFSDDDFWTLTKGAWELLFYEEGLNTTVTVLGNGKDVLLINNGKVDASTLGDLPTQLLLAHLPLLLHSEPRDVCVIGLGSGITAGSALRHPIRSLALLEIESAVLAASHYFDRVNHQPLSDPRTEAIVADGRTYLSMTGRQFDVIISEPPNPWVSGASNLFTREFFETARKRLRPQGILAQWIQLYSLPPNDLGSLLASFTSVFPPVVIFSTVEANDIVVLGSEVPLPIDLPVIQRRLDRVEVAQDLARAQVHRVADLISYFKIGEEEIRALVARSVLNTDDNLLIEFSAPLTLATNTGRAIQAMFNALTAGPVPYLVGLDNPQERASFLASLETAYLRLSRSREAKLVAEALQEMNPESALLQ